MATQRFLASQRRQALVRWRTGEECRIFDLRLGGEFGFMGGVFDPAYPVILRDGEKLMLEQRKGTLTLYRMRSGA